MRESSYEHLLPEKTFSDPTDPTHPQAISAVKALALATSQGQKIYTLNAQNMSQQQTPLGQITIDPQGMAYIQNALAAGKEVVVHQAPITQSGWTGSGYIITDPATGAGAYKIAGGANGAWYDLIAAGLSGLSDPLSEKLRDPNAFNGPLGELSRSFWIKKLAAVAAVAAFIYGISKILSDDKLTALQQGVQITVLLGFTIAATAGAAAAGVYFAAPVTGVVLGLDLLFCSPTLMIG